ncbi:multi-sensor hybrid histidine kinase [Anaeromyxobacter sp. Fw109-5]|nr:multi-sensor hybrid histidine kinase [Anaeromyxobacter sp. Fw109-5]
MEPGPVPTATDTDPLLDILFAHAGIGLCLVAPDGRVVRANGDWLRAMGLSSQAVGEDVLALLGEDGGLTSLLERARRGEPVELPSRRRIDQHGRSTCWEGRLVPVPTRLGAGVLLTAREVPGALARERGSEPERSRSGATPTAERLARERAELLASMAQDLSGGADLDAVLRAAVERGTELLGGVDGAFLLLEPDGRHARVHSEAWKLGRTGTVLDVDAIPAGRAALAERRPRFVSGGHGQGEGLAWLKSRGARSWLIAPVSVQGQRLGLLYVARAEGDRPPQPDLDFAEAIANHAALAITRARGSQALRRSEERFRTLAEHAPDVITRFDRDMRLLYANAALGRVTGIPAAHVTGKTSAELELPADLVACLEAGLARVFETGEPRTLEFRFDGPHGTGYHEARLAPEPGEDEGVASVLAVTRDITERKHAEHSLREAEERARARADELEAVLDAVPAAVCITRERDARHVEANNLCRELLRLPPAVNLSRTVPGDGAPSFRAMKDGVEIPAHELPLQVAAARGVEVRNHEFSLVFADGTRRHVLGNAAPLRDELGDPRGAVVALVDITERRRDEDALGASRASRARAEAGRGGARLVDDLLDVTRISRGKIQLRRTLVDLAGIVRRTVDDHAALFAQQELGLRVSGADRPLWVDGDRTRLAQIVGNVLVNAAKFTGAGGRVEVEVAAEDDARARVTVRDTGVGIAPRLLGRVFEPFIQAEDSLHRSRGGLGLGLALVKGLVELHGGTVEARSEGIARGAEFTLRFPRCADAPSGSVRDEEPAAAARPRRVLIVEDNLDAAETLCLMLEMCGHEVGVAHDGHGAMEQVRAFRPDVVLCDIGLPGMDGYEVARAIRSDLALADLPLVALTGYALPDDQRRAIEAGFDRHLAKPVSSDELQRVIGALSARAPGLTPARA